MQSEHPAHRLSLKAHLRLNRCGLKVGVRYDGIDAISSLIAHAGFPKVWDNAKKTMASLGEREDSGRSNPH